jgi:hypothetical protein
MSLLIDYDTLAAQNSHDPSAAGVTANPRIAKITAYHTKTDLL